eukprot:CAMPEP_0182499800 /NCGR_PEP_ID=MMETSP1321-20130603/7962_1 /TAXON_ID=91990 /ORGANISM="Bolidomonas sp., Strain RCC1657" /LENGTH=135 /DNA_ID=CAMNT_0024704047 /DNA_START=285 /DNA_END=688 /DNA_ORIENTATION=+
MSPAYWQNVVQKKNLGRLITDEEVIELNENKAQKALEATSSAKKFCDNIDEMEIMCLTRKEGSGGKLFGKVSSKDIISELAIILGSSFPTSITKKVKLEIEGGCEVIKNTGEWKVKVKVTGFEVFGSFILKVVGG